MTEKKEFTKDELLLEEYKYIASYIKLGNDVVLRFSTFYFTSISIFMGVLFIIIQSTLDVYQKSLIIIILSIMSIITSFFWCSNTSRTHLKNDLRIKRAKEIEEYFYKKDKFKDTFKMFTYVGENLDSGEYTDFFSRRTRMLTEKYPKVILSFWIGVLIICISVTILYHYNIINI